MPSHEELARVDVLAEKAGAEHADRILALLTTFPAEATQEILDMGVRALEGVIEYGAAVLRDEIHTPEAEIEHFAALIRSAYGARLAVALMPAAGRA